MPTLIEQLHTLPDPRQSSKCAHRLGDIVFMVLCGLLAGADDWKSIARYAREKEAWFRRYLMLPNGIPSYHTFNRVISILPPDSFHDLFIQWVQATLLDGDNAIGVVAVDGKTQRGSRTTTHAGIHTVNAWSTEAGICLGQLKTDDKSNEITAVPKLLKKLAIKGCLVTADAMSCQLKITQQIRNKKADYLLAVKKNQQTLYEMIDQQFMTYWATHPDDQPDTPPFDEQTTQAHGRREHRRCWVCPAVNVDPQFSKWGIKTLAAVQYDRVKGHRCDSNVRYFISSRSMEADALLKATRQHWSVENALHWVLDVAFNEDHSRARQGFAAENLATARQIALNLLKQDKGTKMGIANRRKLCGWSQDYLEQILVQVVS